MNTNNTEEQELDSVTALEHIFALQQQAYINAPYVSAEHRIGDLLQLKALLLNNKKLLLSAISQDYLYRSEDDSTLADFMPVIMSINYTVKKLRRWMKPSKRHVNAIVQPAKAYVQYQPLGVVGIICPWNYPLFLSLIPLVTALSAGNRVMLKMSEFTPQTNHVLKQLLKKIFNEDKVAIIEGTAAVAVQFSKTPFDHLLFTGSTAVGKKVMAAVAENLTPVTLELGGKSPTVIDTNIDIEKAVARFILGKTINAGQTCIAPDYVFCPVDKIETLINVCRAQYQSMYRSVASNRDHGGIINQQHLARLQGYLDDAVEKGATVLPLSDESAEELSQSGKIPLTLVLNVSDDMLVMQEEIFGPILPIVSYEKIDEVLSYIRAKPRPLALYLCSFDKKLQQRFINETHSGGLCINETVMHAVIDDLPFGGIGYSGMGHYHGYEGFLTFSHAKAILVKGKLSFSGFAFPPFGRLIHRVIYKLFTR